MITIVICDDNKPFCDLLEKLLLKYEETEIQVIKFYDVDSLINYCEENEFDIGYIDIEIGKDNGLEVAKKLKYINSKALIIYISSHENYYEDMVQAEPFRFVKKELTDIEKFEKELIVTLLAAIRRINNKSRYGFVFNRSKYFIELDKIKYFYSIARTIHICGEVNGVPSYFYMKMDELQKELRNIDRNFIRISKSYIVNINYVIIKSKNKIVIEGKLLTITSKYQSDFYKKYYERIEK